MDPFDGRVVSTFLRQVLTGENFSIYGSGKQTRSFCFVDDLIEGISNFSKTNYFGPLNLGNPNEMTVLELTEILNEIFKVENQINYLNEMEDDPKQRNPDISLAKELLGWEPNIELKEGLQKTAEWMKSNL